jgi:hypothetical protein
MSEVTAVNIEALTKRIEKLEEYVSTQAVPTFDDVYQDIKNMVGRIDEYQRRSSAQVADIDNRNAKQIANVDNRLANTLADLHKSVTDTLAKLQTKFIDKVHENVRAVTTYEIAESLAKKVLVTRPATRDEIKAGTALAVRQASRHEQ